MAKKLRATHALSAIQHTLSAREFDADMLDHLTSILTQAGYPLFEIGENERVRIELDYDYTPDGDYDLEEEARNLADGTWTAYVVMVDVKCKCCGHWDLYKASLHGIVVETGGEYGVYDHGELDNISDRYLRQVACELLDEVRNG
jgi:hypothetical protein